MNKKKSFIKIIIPLLVIAAGFWTMKLLIAHRAEPKKEVRKDPGIIVEVMKAEKQDTRVIVHGTGTVEPAEEISISPQVTGRVTSTAPDLVVGGFFSRGETLFEIEAIDYKLALDHARSAKAKAEYDLATIESQARIARSEWERINAGSDTPPNPLALYEPQLKNARAALASAVAAVEQAMIDLERTRVTAPFNARVRSEDIDRGQYIRAGSSVAVLSGTDRAEIPVPVSLHDIRWLDVPRLGEHQHQTEASVSVVIGGTRFEWKGRVVRSTGEVDQMTRMIRLIIEVDDPYGLKQGSDAQLPPLVVGTFVDVAIQGKVLDNVIAIPRKALRDNETVWIMDDEGKLQIRPVTPLRIEGETVILTGGVHDGDTVILSSISGAANGMNLRVLRKD